MSDRKYSAFISYSSKDEVWAKWLHKSLETYRTPKHLVGTEGRDEPVPQRLKPVFRDRDELPTSSDLGAVISSALDESDYLIVICSPNSAQSRWVAEEIKTFKLMGKENRILCLIVDGIPNATDEGNESEECFPAPLRYKVLSDGSLSDEREEPIAADAHKDGKPRSKLKLLAGLLGVDFDKLFEREKRRVRQQRMTWLVVAIIVFMAVAYYWQYLKQVELDRLTEESYKLAQESVQARQDGDYVTALRLALEALPQDIESPDRPYIREAELALYQAVSGIEESQIITAHESAISQLAYTPDGKYLISASNDTSLKIWSADNGSLIKQFDQHQSAIDSLVVSPDSKWLVSADDQKLILWDLTKLIMALESRADSFNKEISFSTNSNYLLDNSGTLAAIWDLTTLEDISKDLVEAGRYPEKFAISVDESNIIYAYDGLVSVVNTETREVLRQRLVTTDTALNNDISFLKIIDSNKSIVVGTKNTTYVLNSDNLSEIRQLEALNYSTNTRRSGYAYIPDNVAGYYLLNTGKLSFTDFYTGDTRDVIEDNYYNASYHVDHINKRYFLYQSDLIKVFGSNGDDFKSPATLVAQFNPPGKNTNAFSTMDIPLTYNSANNRLYFGGDDGRIRAYSLEAVSSQSVASLSAEITQPVISADKETLVVMTDDKLELFKVNTNTLERQSLLKNPAISALELSPDQQNLAVVASNNFSIFDLDTGQQKKATSLNHSIQDNARNLYYSDSGQRLTVATSNQQSLNFDTQAEPLERIYNQRDMTSRFLYSDATDQWLAQVASPVIYHFRDDNSVARFKLPTRPNFFEFSRHKFNFDVERALITTPESELRLIDLKTSNTIAQYDNIRGSDVIMDLSPDGQFALLGQYDDASLFDAESGRFIRNIGSDSENRSSIRSASFGVENKRLFYLNKNQDNEITTLFAEAILASDEEGTAVWQKPVSIEDAIVHVLSDNHLFLVNKTKWLLINGSDGSEIARKEFSDDQTPSDFHLNKQANMVSVFLENEYQFWNLTNLTLVASVPQTYSNGYAITNSNGRYAVISDGSSQRVYELDTAKEVASIYAGIKIGSFSDNPTTISLLVNEQQYCYWDYIKHPEVSFYNLNESLHKCQPIVFNQTQIIPDTTAVYTMENHFEFTKNDAENTTTKLKTLWPITFPELGAQTETIVYSHHRKGFVAHDLTTHQTLSEYIPKAQLLGYTTSKTGNETAIFTAPDIIYKWQPKNQTTPEPTKVLQKENIKTIALSPDGSKLSLLNKNGGFEIYDFQTMAILGAGKFELDNYEMEMSFLELRINNTADLLIMVMQNGNSYVWNGINKTVTAIDTQFLENQTYGFNADLTSLFTLNYSGVTMWQTRSGKTTYQNPGQNYNIFKLSESSNKLALANTEQVVVVDLISGKEIFKRVFERYNQPGLVDFSTDESLISFLEYGSDGLTTNQVIYQIVDGKKLTEIPSVLFTNAYSLGRSMSGVTELRRRSHQDLHKSITVNEPEKSQYRGLNGYKIDYQIQLDKKYGGHRVVDANTNKQLNDFQIQFMSSALLASAYRAEYLQDRGLLLVQSAESSLQIIEPYSGVTKTTISGIDGALSDFKLTESSLYTISDKDILQSWNLDSGTLVKNYGSVIDTDNTYTQPYIDNNDKSVLLAYKAKQTSLIDLQSGEVLQAETYDNEIEFAQLDPENNAIFILFKNGDYKKIPVLQFGNSLLVKARELAENL